MMDICRKTQEEMKQKPDILHESIFTSSKNLNPKSFVETESSCKSARFSLEESFICSIPKENVHDNDTVKPENVKEETQKGLLNVIITPRSQLDKKFPSAITEPVQRETAETNRECTKRNILTYPEHVRKHLRSMLSIKRSVNDSVSKVDEDCFPIIPDFTEQDAKNSELNVETSKDTKSGQEKLHKQVSKIRRNETNSTCKMNDISFKIRKRKGKVRNCASNTTVTIKNTRLLSRQETKRRRHTGHDVACQQLVPPKHRKKYNDVEEIFHNVMINKKNSGISTKYPKHDQEVKCVKKQHLSETVNQNQKQSCSKYANIRKYQSHNKENQQELCKTLRCQNNSRIAESESAKKESKSDECPDKSSMQCKTPQCEYVCNKYNNSIITPSYEMPTLSSKLKRSNRSYFGRFNFQNIPFVVGTSITPSHNLGLNIQQVLNIMKTRQPNTHDTAPLIIRKINRGTKPMSFLLQQMNARHEKSFFNPVSQMTGLLDDKGSLNINQNKKSPVSGSLNVEKTQDVHATGSMKMIPKGDNNIFGQSRREKGDFYETDKIKQQSSFIANWRNQQRISRMSLKNNIVCGDQNVHTADLRNSKEIRNVLVTLHDQFETMNTRYEKLQAETEKSNDETSAKELSTLEKELQVKEEEINAVISLYKEVMTLKQQMKVLHEKNSLVCIATESSLEPFKNLFPISILNGKPHLMDPTQILGHRKGNVNGATREPPVSMQLTALLRQIQSFHKHLVS